MDVDEGYWNALWSGFIVMGGAVFLLVLLSASKRHFGKTAERMKHVEKHGCTAAVSGGQILTENDGRKIASDVKMNLSQGQ